MLFKNILLFVGMAVAVPVKTITSTTTVSLVQLQTSAPEQVITFEHVVSEEPTVTSVNETVDTSNYDKVVLVDEKNGEKVEVLTADVDLNPVIEDKEEEPIIPENEEPDVDTSVCSKDLLLMGNKIEEHSVCDDVYNACTTKELLSIIIAFYTKTDNVSIEYVINDGVNKGSVSENCANVLINSKIFHKETTVIEPVSELPPVEKITDLNQDIPAEAPLSAQDEAAVKKIDAFAEFGEDPIEE